MVRQKPTTPLLGGSEHRGSITIFGFDFVAYPSSTATKMLRQNEIYVYY